MNLVLLGPPGAGKGTQAKALSERLNLAHISTGDLLRQSVKEETALGKLAKDYMRRGTLVPDELVGRMLAERFSRPDILRGFILDGYPRNIPQAVKLDEILRRFESNIDLVIYLETSEAVILQRLTGRRVCSSCGRNYHLSNMPPKQEGICDDCSGQLFQREDDKEETIKKRLAVYRQEAAELVRYYEEKNKLKRLNADEDAELVLEQIITFAQTRNDSLKV
jgi:adenylate kinase